MYKKLVLAAAIAAMSVGAQAQTTLQQGDIAFTAFGGPSSGVWGFSFVSFVDLAAGTTIRFTDNNITAALAFNSTNESVFSWTSSSLLSAGTVVTVGTDKSVSAGSFSSLTSTAWNHAGATETLWAYVPSAAATLATPSYTLAAISMRTSANNGDNPVGTGLSTSDASFINAAGGARWAQFNHIADGSTYASADQLRASIADMNNWTLASTSTAAGQALAINTQALISPVPEPGTYAMLLAGLGLVGAMARRRRQA